MFKVGSKIFLEEEYSVKKIIGSGGFATVYLCEKELLHTKELYAIKVIEKEKVQHPSILERVYREAKLLNTLKHEKIVKIYDIYEDSKLVFIVMEYIPGTNLDDLIANDGAFIGRERLAIKYMLDILDALLYMWKKNKIHHRDIKPANVIVNKDNAYLIDFGNAKEHEDIDKSITALSGVMLGTPGYRAPSVDFNRFQEEDDVYAVATTLLFTVLGYNSLEVPGDPGASWRKAMNHEVELGRFQNTYLGHWIDINTDPYPDKRMNLEKAKKTLELIYKYELWNVKAQRNDVLEMASTTIIQKNEKTSLNMTQTNLKAMSLEEINETDDEFDELVDNNNNSDFYKLGFWALAILNSSFIMALVWQWLMS